MQLPPKFRNFLFGTTSDDKLDKACEERRKSHDILEEALESFEDSVLKTSVKIKTSAQHGLKNRP